MSMSEDSESFQQLQRLLALKRHEQPPPGYFHQFSHGVILRIKAGELGEPEGKWWAFDGSWLRWLWTACERRPVLAGGAGVAFCGFFVAAAFISGAGDVPAVSQNLSASPQYVAVHPTLAETPTEADYSVSSADFPGFVRASVERPQPSLFSPSGNFQLQPTAQSVSFHP